jgi:hypothetical protein
MLFYFFCMVFIAASTPSAASEEPAKGLKSHISIGMGWETLNYREYEPDTHLDSEADVSNWAVGFNALKRWEYIFCEIKGIVPIDRNDDHEDWSVSGILAQQNSLEYGWSRIDTYLGYPFTPLLNTYIGLRWSEAKQDRMDFFSFGAPVEGSVTETVTAWFLALGLTGNVVLNPRWRLSYSGSYFEPISLEVKNSGLPGWEVSDAEGYTYEFEGQAEYAVTQSISAALILYGGRTHWSGSDWTLNAGKFVKWPENDTRYFGGMVNLRWLF